MALPALELSAFLLAALGGAHCAGMCAGFAGALQVHRPPEIPAARFAAAYHAGRISGYTLAGWVAGAAGAALFSADLLPIQVALLAAGGAMLLAVGWSLFGRGIGWLRSLEPLGAWFWRRLQPYARRVLPPRTLPHAWLAGLFWGWLPCGMVYGALPLALGAASALRGAGVMLAFGVGTLPAMILVDVAAARLGRAVTSPPSGPSAASAAIAWLRPIAGLVVMVFGASALAQAARVAGMHDPTVLSIAALCH